ncbi:MAG: MarR family transcriptional regulator [Myxococcota bacterium]
MSSPPEQFAARFEAEKRASMAQLLMRCARLVNERGLALVREHLGVPLRASHTALFPHIDLEGTRLTDLARRVGITKQAAGQLVGELEQMGVVERSPDPEDGRAKRIRFIREGPRSVLQGLAVLREVEAQLEAQLGKSRMRSLHGSLLELLAVLENPDHAP